MYVRAWARATLFGLVIGTVGTACSRTQIEFGSVEEGNVGGDAGSGFGGDAGVGGFGGSLGGSSGIGGDAGISGTGGSVGGAAGSSSCESLATNECQQCTCAACLPEWETCSDDGGCLAILDCADTTGCSGVSCYLGPCNQVIDQNGGPFGPSAGLAQDVGQCRQDSGCPCGSGGSGGSAGTGGFGGFGGSSGSGGNGGAGGSGGTGPLACFTCITQQCPAVGECLLDQACRDGAICTFQQCLAGGGGFPDFQCVVTCFNGDFQAALKAFQAFQCFFSQCSTACAGGIPGFPGGGFGGSGGAN